MKAPIAKAALSLSLLFLASAPSAQIPAIGLCDTGLTPASPITGCATSTLVTPINPVSGGPSVDGNWQLASPYPSAPFSGGAPNPCALTTFGPAWIDAPSGSWYNPYDGISQWISPKAEEQSAGGWYVYRTTLSVPASESKNGKFLLTAKGQVLGDDIFVILFNTQSPAEETGNYTGPRVEFTSANFTPG